jgi:ABC-type multidrug transport system fused ATPase/permease subunit
VLDEGKVIEKGTHDELIELGGAYKALYDMQLSSHEIIEVES